MRFIIQNAVLVLGTVSCLVGCGSKDDDTSDKDDKESNTVTDRQYPAGLPTSMAIATLAELPVCDDTRHQQLVYVMETKEFQTCQHTVWTVIDMTPPAAPVDYQAQFNALTSIQLGDKLTDMVPEARTLLLSSAFTHETLKASTDECSVKLAGDSYDGLVIGDDTFKYSFALILRGGKVVFISAEIGDEGPESQQVGCGDR